MIGKSLLTGFLIALMVLPASAMAAPTLIGMTISGGQNRLVSFDIATGNATLGVVMPGLGGTGGSFSFSPDGNRAYYRTNIAGDDVFVVADTRSGALISSQPAPSAATLAYNAATDSVFGLSFGAGQSALVEFDPDTGTTDTGPSDALLLGSSNRVLSADGSTYYVAGDVDGSGTNLMAYDTDTLSRTAAPLLGLSPSALAVNPVTGALFGLSAQSGPLRVEFVSIDPTTGATTPVVSGGLNGLNGVTGGTFIISPDGETGVMFGLDSAFQSVLVSFDLETGDVLSLNPTALSPFGYALAFREAAVPAPAALWLMLAGLIACARRRG